MNIYLKILQDILSQGHDRMDRTGVGTRALFGCQMRINLKKGFPLLTTKKIHIKSVVHELLWFLRGETNIRYLKEQGVSIWDAWADENGELGPVYGRQWRAWRTADGRCIDQMEQLLYDIRNNPHSRRLVVSAWNVGELQDMALPPCHAFVQFFVADGNLSCQLYQRSADAFLGLPFNLASYALLTHLIAQQCDLIAHELIWTGGDCHIYHNHMDQVRVQLTRAPKTLPTVEIKRKAPDLYSYVYEDFVFHAYDPHPTLRAEIAV